MSRTNPPQAQAVDKYGAYLVESEEKATVEEFMMVRRSHLS